MMKPLMALLFFGLLLSCKENPGTNTNAETITNVADAKEAGTYPGDLWKVLEAHGSLEKWKQQRTLSYQLESDGQTETHTVDLPARKDLVEAASYSLGFDGKQVWLLDPDKKFEGDAVFYHNLIFYFFAMPFVLADDGIVYTETEALVHEGKSYPGIRISYESGVGTSPKDEYFLHYDPENYTMAWLGYTVTYFSDTPSDELHWIRYANWKEVNGLLLPESLSWYENEGRTMIKVSNTMSFNNVELSAVPKEAEFYTPPAGAEIVNKKT